MAYYSITLIHGDTDPQAIPPTGHTPEPDLSEHWAIPAPIQDIFEGDSEGITLETMLLTFSDGTQVVWGQTA